MRIESTLGLVALVGLLAPTSAAAVQLLADSQLRTTIDEGGWVTGYNVATIGLGTVTTIAASINLSSPAAAGSRGPATFWLVLGITHGLLAFAGASDKSPWAVRGNAAAFLFSTVLSVRELRHRSADQSANPGGNWYVSLNPNERGLDVGVSWRSRRGRTVPPEEPFTADGVS